ncbi:aldose 1-epimerase family protein [Microbacterium album]|uniref:Aldose 1-epimerase n=1 Tax=Microbacterium album TaxID=2053191 RepID=A0A917IF15_9MICO|nr:aldose 1-epimerase family protein [Microbacterium album]GGH42056.1 aldose 1-epimerase [Microbacterium album]
MNAPRRIDPTGTQVHLRREGGSGEVTAQLAQVGAALRALTVGGVDVVARYPQGTTPPFASGIVLVPWPNRVRDGRWTHVPPGGQGDPADQQLDLTEPSRGNAIHGLLRNTGYDIDASGDRATLSATVYPQHGYPFALDTSVAYALTDDGIEVTHELVNVGERDAPVAIGAHPFLCIGGVDTADLVLTVPAETWFEVDDRMLPIAEHPVRGAVDLRGGVRVADADLDMGFGSLRRDADGLARTTLAAPDGRVVTLWQDADFEYVQAFRTDAYPGHPLAVAVEPMTAPADAFNSGRGVRWLAPGERWQARWGISLSA